MAQLAAQKAQLDAKTATPANTNQGATPEKPETKAAEVTKTEEDPRLGDWVHYMSLTDDQIDQHSELVWDKFADQLFQDVGETVNVQNIKLDAILVFNDEKLDRPGTTQQVASVDY